jgi:hypothetical protein
MWQIVGFLAAGLVFTCSAVNDFIYSTRATMEAAGAGHILLSIIQARLSGSGVLAATANDVLDNLDILLWFHYQCTFSCLCRFICCAKGYEAREQRPRLVPRIPRRPAAYEHEQPWCSSDVY